ncbi:MAG: acetyl-CoA carboxylase biotin carboxylase subunit [Luteitalea sp.]|nr:acetyl-CoA carboxylase biotin carboxylase subunit [Luteitalea sp.]
MSLLDVRKILVANRGEIAVRVMRACRDLGIRSVAVFSDCDRAALHVRLADEAHYLGASPPAESYLRIDRLVDIARRSGADAVHPGYGFLAENSAFATACREAGLVFIGPSPDAIARMGRKTVAREIARAAGVPVVPGTDRALDPQLSDADVARVAASVGYPLLVKAVAGGGGKGMRSVETRDELPDAMRAARSEAGSAFGDTDVYFERRLDRPRHVEIQLLGDEQGTIVPFVERECSVQRRHQKVIEESPSVAVTPELRARMAAAAEAVARAVGYTSAGTIEFLLDGEGRFYFLEMNTRLQVEHPVTEAVTGVDLVVWQMRIARGERVMPAPERTLVPNGHAIECRIYAEDPDLGFLPSPGRITALVAPAGPGIRDDSGVRTGSEVPIFYDSMISKLVAWGDDRTQALERMRRALAEYDIRGINTTIPFFQWMLQTPEFQSGAFDTTTLDAILTERRGRPFSETPGDAEETAVVATALQAFLDASAAALPAPGPGPDGRPSSMGVNRWKVTGRYEALRDR